MTWEEDKNYHEANCCGICKYSEGEYYGHETYCTLKESKVLIDWICDDYKEIW